MTLQELAARMADWAHTHSVFTIYLFGSRVRGDHRPDSDLDVIFDLGFEVSAAHERACD
jgi:predicted nucleotidyltransferase